LVARFEETARNCDKRGPRFRRRNAVVASFPIKVELKSFLEL
jgi:hypothetical protein